MMIELTEIALDYILERLKEEHELQFKTDKLLNSKIRKIKELSGNQIILEDKIRKLNEKLEHNEKENQRLHETIDTLHEKIKELEDK